MPCKDECYSRYMCLLQQTTRVLLLEQPLTALSQLAIERLEIEKWMCKRRSQTEGSARKRSRLIPDIDGRLACVSKFHHQNPQIVKHMILQKRRAQTSLQPLI